MNEAFHDNPFGPLKETTLSSSEREHIRAHVRRFVSLERPRHWYGWFSHHVVATLILIVFLGGGSVLWAADMAEPDSSLYAVRTTVNDQVRITVAGDELDRMEKELELLGDYMSEEETLMERELTL